MSLDSIKSSPTLIDTPQFDDIRSRYMNPLDSPTSIQTSTTINSNAGVSGLQHLYGHISESAIYDPNVRFDAPKCHPETRKAVIDDIMSWICHTPPLAAFSALDNDKFKSEPILLVSGQGGVGKSFIMQTVAERCSNFQNPGFGRSSHPSQALAASFFFHFNRANRNSKANLVPTLAYQLTQTVPNVVKYISKAIERDPAIFTKKLAEQMEKLILEPLAEAAVAHRNTLPFWPKVILIDGLDQCKGEENQLDVLSVLRKAALDNRMPFRIVISSQPHSGIKTQFLTPGLESITHKIALDKKPNIDSDIRLYLQCKFSDIRRRHKIPRSTAWPPDANMDQLIYNASGKFIYASTVIRFVDTDEGTASPEDNSADGHSSNGHEEVQETPADRLKVVLEAKYTKSYQKPLASLDALYIAILGHTEDPMMSARYLREIMELLASDIELTYARVLFYFSLRPSQFERIFRRLSAIIEIPNHGYGSLRTRRRRHCSLGYGGESQGAQGDRFRFHHKSFLDFFQDPSRAKHLYVPRSRLYTDLAVHYLQAAAVHHESQPTDSKHEIVDDAAATMLSQLHLGKFCSFSITNDPVLQKELAQFDVELWLFYALAFKDIMNGDIEAVYQWVHVECPWSGCRPICRRWRRAILRFWDRIGGHQPTVIDRIWDKFTPRDIKRVKLITSRYRL